MDMLTRVVKCLGLIAGICAWSAGCGSGVDPAEATPPQQLKFEDKAQVKQMLEGMVQSGAGHSGMPGIRNTIEGWKASDTQLAESLLKDMGELEAAVQASNKTKVRQIAKRMADKL
jgi:hypothetical protein